MFHSFILPFMLHMVTYWGTSLIFYLIDNTDELIKNFRYKKAAITSFENQMFISFPVFYLLKDHIYDSVIKCQNDIWLVTLYRLFLIINLSNLLFYGFHYLLHSKVLFKYIHYVHHEYIEPIGVATFYAHPIDHLLTNVLAFLIPTIFVGINYNMMLIMLSLGTIFSVLSHCNFQLKIFNWVLFNDSHIIHHKYFNCNYGFGRYLDKFMNTYRQ